MRVVGLDPSLTGFGLAAVEDGTVIAAEELNTGKLDGRDRFEMLLDRVGEFARAAQLVAIEGPSYGSKTPQQRGHHERAGLWWAIVQDCWRDEVPVVVVGPKARAKYATGNGNADKALVTACASERFGLGPIRSHNVADALTIAALVARRVGEPIDTLDDADPLDRARLAAVEALTMPPGVPA